MLRIQVLGSGLIPRGHGIAPKKEPFPADLRLIGIILSTGGLKVNFVHPNSGKLVPLTRENYQAMYTKYQNRVYTKTVEDESNDQEKVGEADGIVKEGISLPADGQVHETNLGGPVIPPADVAPVVSVAPVTPEAPIVTPVVGEAQAIDAAKSEEFTMKPIVAPEEKAKNFQNNKSYNQQNGGQRNQTTNQR